MVCERWCVTKWCVKDGVWQSCVWKLCVKEGVCERGCVWKRVCVKDGGWQSCVWKLCVKDGVWQSCVVCDRRAAGGRGGRGVSNKVERWCVTKWYVKESVWKMVCDKVVCVKVVCEFGVWKMVVDKVVCESCVWKMVCDKVVLCVTGGRREEEEDQECLTNLCDKEAAPGDACHAERKCLSPSATPATQNEGGCDKAPRLPRKTNVDLAKCHACHAKCRGVTGD